MLILENVQVFGHGDQCMTVVIENGIVSWLGSTHVAKSLNLTAQHTIQCEGHWLAPGFMDNHVHLSATGLALKSRQVAQAQNNEQLQDALLALPQSEILLAHGYEDSNWRADIWDLPIAAYVSRVDVHSGVISASLADRIQGIQALSGWGERGRISGKAHERVRDFCFSVNPMRREIEIAATEFLANGVVAVHEMSGPSIAGYANAHAVSDFALKTPLDVHLWWGEFGGFEKARALNAYGCGGDLFIDGSLGSETAALSSAYENGGYGNRYCSVEEISHHIEMALEFKFAVSFHAIGDAANKMISESLKSLSHLQNKIRLMDLRIEHAEYVSDEDLNVFQDYGVAFSVQPKFDLLWGQKNGMYEQRLGSRYTHLNTFARYSKIGIPLLLGSDSPVTDVNPWGSVKAALAMNQENQSLSSRAAFRAHTTDGYRRIGDERVHGIQVGSPADVVLWEIESLNLVPAPDFVSQWSTDQRSGVAAIPNLENSLPRCLLTIKGGELAYAASGWQR